MGNRISTDPEDIQLLIREANGQLSLRKTRIDPSKMEACTPLPVSLTKNVKYAFMANTDKKWHAHVYADDICDIKGNEVFAGNTLGGKNVETMGYTGISNSTHFNFNKDELNKPEFPFFTDHDGIPQFTAKSAYTQCKEMSFKPQKDNGGKNKGFFLNHNGFAAVVYTDDKCANEYISTIPGGRTPDQYKKDRVYNQDYRSLSKSEIPLPYTNVKTFIEPTATSNARFYRTFKTDAPPAPSDYPDYLQKPEPFNS